MKPCIQCHAWFKPGRREQRYCSPQCGHDANRLPWRPPASVWRYLVNLVGNREAVARSVGYSVPRIYQFLPVTDLDRMHNGLPVTIGGILVKRCSGCGVTREVDKFGTYNLSRSGCTPRCDYCRLSTGPGVGQTRTIGAH